MVIGIDIGTSYSSVAILKDGKAVPLKHEANITSVPSAVFIDRDGTRLIGQAALNSRMSDPARFRDNFKRDFGTDKPYLLGGEEITPDEIYTEYFSFFRKRVEEATGEGVTKTYITHPVGYSDEKKVRLRKAAEYAGLNDIVLVDEPTAAAWSFFADQSLRDGETLLVYDFGGGTLDLTLVEKAGDGFHLLTDPVGADSCGGADFDRAVYQDIVEQLSKVVDLSRDLTKSKFCLWLYQEAVTAKHHLTHAVSFNDEIPCAGDYHTYTLTRERFNNLIADKVELSCKLISEIARNAGLTPLQIDKVLCVGGSTRVPFVRESVEKTVGKPVLISADPELSVCMGAISGSAYDAITPKIEEELSQTPEGQYILGCAYYSGRRGKERDYSMAVFWLKKAAEQDHTDAQHMLGLCYRNGHGVNENASAAAVWFEKAARGGNMESQIFMGSFYKTGYGVSKNENEAIVFYNLAAEQGSAEAQFLLGNIYSRSNYKLASEWYKKAAAQGREGAKEKAAAMEKAAAEKKKKDEEEAKKTAWEKAQQEAAQEAQRARDAAFKAEKATAQQEINSLTKKYRRYLYSHLALYFFVMLVCYSIFCVFIVVSIAMAAGLDEGAATVVCFLSALFLTLINQLVVSRKVKKANLRIAELKSKYGI